MSSPNHDGEASENWDAFYYPLGDAREALLAFAALLTDIAMNVRVRLRWNFELTLTADGLIPPSRAFCRWFHLW
jgi:hypothetical protein